MGLLDDAIREHLELKRRRGGDPAEIQRAEREALGPVRREPEPLQPAGYDEGPEAEHELAGGGSYGELEPVEYDEPFPEVPGELRHEPYPEAAAGPPTEFLEPPPADEPLGELPAEPAPPLSHGAVGTGPETGPEMPPPAEPPYGLRDEEDPWLSEPAANSPAAMPHEEHVEPEPFVAPRRAPAEPPPDHLNQETAEYRLEHAHDEEEAEDVLEETPDFLQDAPEHDRLWFEQRPPRDFDFDE